MQDRLNEIRIVGTDSGCWFLFHPDDLAHRHRDPIDWYSYDFAIRREFAAGTLVGVATGGDGAFSVRLTDQELTSREKKYAVMAQSFRLRLRHGRVLIDGAYVLPSEAGESVADDSADWISLPNGDYRVTISAIAWYDEPGAVDHKGKATKDSLTSYVAVFEAVDNLETVNIPSSLPRLDPSAPDYVFFPNPGSQPVRVSPEEGFAIFPGPEVVFPGLPRELSLTREQHERLERVMSETSGFSLLFASQPKPKGIATLFAITSYGSSFDDATGQPRFSMSGNGAQIVELSRIWEKNDILWATVSPLTRPLSNAGLESIQELKRRFAAYVTKNPGYLTRVPYAQFQAERVAALTNPLEVGWAIASVLDLPPESKYQLLSTSEAELIHRLKDTLSAFAVG